MADKDLAEVLSFSPEDLWTLKCQDLKKLLKLFNESVSGSKSSLINRLYAIISRRRGEKSECITDCSSDSLDANFGKEGASYADLLRLAVGRQWSTDIRTLPDTNFHQVYEYLVVKTNKFGAKLMKGTAYKKERAYEFFAEGNLGDVQIARGKGHTWVKARTIRSMVKEKVNVCVIFKENGDVYLAACSCPAGQGVDGFGKCNHVGGLLYYVEEFNKRGLKSQPEKVSCTSVLNGWVVPRNLTVKPQPLPELKIKKSQFGKTNNGPTCTQYDPRALHDRAKNIPAFNKLYTDLEDCIPASGFFLFHDHPEEDVVKEPDFIDNIDSQDVAENVEVFTSPMRMYVPKINGPCVAREGQEEYLYKACTTLDKFKTHVKFDGDITSDALSEQVKKFIMEDCVDEDIIEEIEKQTKEQSKSKLWSYLHEIKLTASNFGRAIKCTRSPDGVLKSALYSHIDNKAVKYGLRHEHDAIRAYVKFKEDAAEKVEVERVGLILRKDRPGYGASLDGRVFDSVTQSYGGLECKCPISKSGMTVEEACRDKTFYLTKDSQGNITLNKTHNYYFQIQGQMYITNLKWTDFVVWFGEDSLFVERINFDAEEWNTKCLPALDYFYEKAFIPELLTGCVKNGTSLYKSGQWISYKNSVKRK